MIWREPGTRYREPNIVERNHYRGGGLLVWARIATNDRTDLHVFAGGSVTAVRYRDEILHQGWRTNGTRAMDGTRHNILGTPQITKFTMKY
ncbi:hypothetical protein AVEN_4029-1 [Araneus ventricosus]|uniref:Uncharacterized protein n=1 Tax=Araneus ventricosus TaxID=182803 RepID=A0A4Y2J4F9_ARAVE|nr:hypothetical protein AVEN_4029-1 [Araneus ventricosus]